jgi:CheY-like chemotaxis protein
VSVTADPRGRILLIDDDEGVRRAYGPVLAALGEVETATDGREAIERLRTQRFNVIVSDLVMPNLMGDEFLGWRRPRRGTPWWPRAWT